MSCTLTGLATHLLLRLTQSLRDSKSTDLSFWESTFISLKQDFDSFVGLSDRELLERAYRKVMLAQSADPVRDLILEVERVSGMLDICESRVLQIDGMGLLLKSILALSRRARALYNGLDEMLCYSMVNISGLVEAHHNLELSFLSW